MSRRSQKPRRADFLFRSLLFALLLTLTANDTVADSERVREAREVGSEASRVPVGAERDLEEKYLITAC